MATERRTSRAKRRRYSDEDRANALAALTANAGNVEQTAEQLGIPRQTLEGWAKGTRHPEAAATAALKKAPLADRLEEIAHALVDCLPGKVEAADLRQAATALGIAVDKMRLLREQPTNITSHGLTDEERAKRVAALLERGRTRGA